jgi:U5 small nuclear ribonucleoprotein component
MYADTYGIVDSAVSFIDLIITTSLGSLDVDAFANRLWGDIYFNEDTRKFTRKQAGVEQNRTFVHFILEPLYKLYSNVLSEDTETLKETLDGLNIHLKPVMYKMDVRPLLKAVLDQFFGPAAGLVDMIVEKIPSPLQGASIKVCCVPFSSELCTHLLGI